MAHQHPDDHDQHPQQPVLVRWPADEAARARARASVRPCLLVIARGQTPPVVDAHEDWIVETADERDVQARLTALVQRTQATAPDPPSRGTDASPGVAELHGLAGRAARLLIERPHQLVPTSDLAGGAATAEEVGRIIGAIRPRLAAAGWSVHRVGASGYLATAKAGPR